MSVIWEWGLTLLAAFGLFSLGGLLFGGLRFPSGAGAYVVICGAGDGAGLEQTVGAFLHLRERQGLACPVLLVDTGLNEEGRAAAELLCRRWPALRLCTPEELLQNIS